MDSIETLIIFDFDGTLMDTPIPSTGKEYYKNKMGIEWPHKGWWGNLESLNPDIFEMSVIKKSKELYDKYKNMSNVHMVLMTGRIQKFSNLIKNILKDNGFNFDDYKFNNTNDTLSFKLREIDLYVNSLPRLKKLIILDDRMEHIEHFIKYMDTLHGIETEMIVIESEKDRFN